MVHSGVTMKGKLIGPVVVNINCTFLSQFRCPNLELSVCLVKRNFRWHCSIQTILMYHPGWLIIFMPHSKQWQDCQVTHMGWETPAFLPFPRLSHLGTWFSLQKRSFQTNKKHFSSFSGCWDIKVQRLRICFHKLCSKWNKSILKLKYIVTFWKENMTWKLLDDNSKVFFTAVLLWIEK